MLPVHATHQIAVLGNMGTEAVTLDELDARLPMIGRAAIVAAAGRLVARGYVERQEDGVYKLSQAGIDGLKDGMKIGGDPQKRRKNPVYADSLRQRAWKAMTLEKRFTVGAIAQLAVRDETDGEDSIRRFCLALTRAGYLAELPTRVKGEIAGSNGFKQWRLIRETGEIAPRYIAADKAFHDRNDGKVYPCR